jgi:hypothetical protein
MSMLAINAALPRADQGDNPPNGGTCAQDMTREVRMVDWEGRQQTMTQRRTLHTRRGTRSTAPASHPPPPTLRISPLSD